jgi:hypothetical protein
MSKKIKKDKKEKKKAQKNTILQNETEATDRLRRD